MKISIIIPAYNEEEVLDDLRKELERVTNKIENYDFEIIIVENGSSDSSYKKLIGFNKEDSRFKILQLSKNFGCDGAITAGLKYAKGDAAILMDADLQDPPELISEFIKKWEEGYEIIYGVIQKREGVSSIKKIFSSLFYKIINRLTGNVIPKDASDFRLIDKKVYKIVNKMDERNKFLRGVISWTGFKQIGVSFKRPARFAGESKAGFSTLMEVAMNGIFSFSYFPLKLTTILGFIIFIGSFILFFIQIGLHLIYGRVVPGLTTMILLMLFLFGMLFFLLGMIGMYIARIYDEVKQRPNFIVKDEIGL
ncbi:MAG: glycosyltransferase family 2 protein [Nanoarchaeota archaeon]|nr:glycosyltransferase family 2 protein [Nanoarchaeota archaeon]